MKRTHGVLLVMMCLPTVGQAQESTGPRLVVTGHSPTGRAIVVSDGAPLEEMGFGALPGLEFVQVWGTAPGAGIPVAGEHPMAHQPSFLPETGGTRMVLVSLPTMAQTVAAMSDPGRVESFQAEYGAKVPDLAMAHGDPANPGMHRTESIDYVVILRGQVELELDDGVRVPLAPGDMVVQNGTSHAWHNLGDEPALLVAVMVGMQR